MAASIYRCGYLLIDAAIYKIDFLKFNLLSNGLIEKFWDALWLGIGPFLCLTEETLDRAGTDAPHHQPRVGQDCANMMSQFRRFFPPHHTCVGSMCHIIANFLSSSSEILLSTVVWVTSPVAQTSKQTFGSVEIAAVLSVQESRRAKHCKRSSHQRS